MAIQVTIADVRDAMESCINETAQQQAPVLSDEQLLKINIFNDFKMDSLELVEMIMHLERNLGISIPDEMFSEFPEATVKNLIDCCNKYAVERRC